MRKNTERSVLFQKIMSNTVGKKGLAHTGITVEKQILKGTVKISAQNLWQYRKLAVAVSRSVSPVASFVIVSE